MGPSMRSRTGTPTPTPVMRLALATMVMIGMLVSGSIAATGLPFLQLSSGARSAAMGDAAVALSDPQALYHNPAALALGERSAAFTHTEWIEDIRHEYVVLSRGNGDRAVALGMQISQASDLEFRTGPTTEALGDFGVYEGALSLAYGRMWNPHTRIGGALKLIRQSIYTENASGYAADLGALYDLGDDVKIGVALRNVGSMNKLDRSATDLPRAVHAGFTYEGVPALILAFETRRVDGSTTAHAGAEYRVGRRLRLRGGYQNADSRDVGLGFGVESGSYRVNYAFVPFAAGLGDAHRLSVVLRQAIDR